MVPEFPWVFAFFWRFLGLPAGFPTLPALYEGLCSCGRVFGSGGFLLLGDVSALFVGLGRVALPVCLALSLVDYSTVAASRPARRLANNLWRCFSRQKTSLYIGWPTQEVSRAKSEKVSRTSHTSLSRLQ